MQTNSEENYLKAIFLLSKQSSNKVSVTALASALGNNPASVIEMLKKLSEKKHIDYDKSKGIKLRDTANKAALLVVRRHRLWELFLQNKLGYTWDEVHDIAEQLEHVHDPELADRLDEFLGFPQFDPHGEAIPDKNGLMENKQYVKLSDCNPGDKIMLTSVLSTSVDFLKFLNSRALKLGMKMKIKSIEPFDKTMIVQFNKRPAESLSEMVCERLLVERLK